MNGYNLFGLLSWVFAALVGYWLVTPSQALSKDPMNSIVLIIFLIAFIAIGIFLIGFGYMFNANEEG